VKKSGHIKILIVDDNVSTLQLLKHMLKKTGFEIICASSGNEAIDVVSENDLALILLDVVLDGASGMDIAEIIRGSDGKSHIPIIFMTGHDKDSGFEFKGYEIGAVDFIYKPINPVVLHSKVGVFAELYLREKKLVESNLELETTLSSLRKEIGMRKKVHQALKRSEEQYRTLYETSQDMESQLRQAQKMEAVGTLAGGIAHDFNNILAAIMGYIELSQFDVPESNPARHSLDQVLKATHRAKKLVSQILAFSRQNNYEKKPVYVQCIINECVELLRASIPSTVAIEKDLCQELKAVKADSTQIHQVIMNLCTNAYHAMDGGEGRIDITLSPYGMRDEDCLSMLGLSQGEYMRLVIGDTGCGMDEKILSKIFEPYFTTKAKGQGTGMGLSVVHGIIKSHGGRIDVTSEPGKGSRFTLYLPVIDMSASDHTDVPALLPLGRERILFVDDEETLVDLGVKILERLGYEVVSETSSLRAFERFKDDPQGFDLVITDMTMPDLTGIQLARKIKMISPGVPIILCTGYHKEINVSKVKDFGIDFLLLKPLKIMDLATVIRDAVQLEEEIRVFKHA